VGGEIGETGAFADPVFLIPFHRLTFRLLALNWVWTGVECSMRELPP
jgi:hypothetical protein